MVDCLLFSPSRTHGAQIVHANCRRGNGCLQLESSKNQYVSLTRDFTYQSTDLQAVTITAWINTNSNANQIILSMDRSE